MLTLQQKAESHRSRMVPPRTSNAHPLVRQLERHDFFAQVALTRALLQDLQATFQGGEGHRELTTGDLRSQSFRSVAVALALVEDTLRQIERVVQDLEKSQQDHSQKWFSSWRKVDVHRQLKELLELAPELRGRTEQLMQVKQFWVLCGGGWERMTF